MSRGLSTTADVLVCLVLVSAAATTLALPTGSVPQPDADAAATLVERTTADIDYRLVVPDTDRFPSEIGFHRHTSGRLAALLANSAVRNTRIDGRQLTAASNEYEQRVAAAVVNATGPRTQVTARWQPFPGANITGRAVAGSAPPADVTVASQTRTVAPAEAAETRRQAKQAAEDFGYVGVAAVAATHTTERLWPTTGMRNALAADYPTDRLAALRYEAAGRHFDIPVADALETRNVTALNSRLQRALQRRYETRLRATFDSPQEAARAIRPAVRIVVRRWSA